MNLDLAKSLDRMLGRAAGRVLSFVDGVRESLAPTRPVGPVDRVLVVKFWGLGNWALLRPVVRDLRERFATARFTIATLAGNRPLVEDLADELLLVRPTSAFRALADLAHAVRRLRRAPHALGLDFEPFATSGALLARFGGVGQRIGFASGSGRDGLYTVTVPFRRDAHVTRSFRDLAEAAGATPGPYVAGHLEADPREVEALGARLGPLASYVVLHPGSGDNFPGRRWSPAGFAAVGRAAVERGARVFVTGSPSEAGIVRAVTARIGSGAEGLAGALSLEALVALLAGARALVSNDTGPVHLASQLGVPVLAIYGPNTPVRYGPLSAGSRVFYRDLPCSPCLTNASYRSSRCRIFTCMDSIPTGAVVGALDALLAGASKEASR